MNTIQGLLSELAAQESFHRLGWTLLHFMWQGLIVAALLAICIRLMSRRSANARYVTACGAMVLLAILPVLTYWLAPIPVSVEASQAETIPAPTALLTEYAIVATHIEISEVISPEPGAIPATAVAATPWTQRVSDFVQPALPYAVGLWIFGVGMLSLFRAAGLARVRQLRKCAAPPSDAALIDLMQGIAMRLGVSRPVQLAQSEIIKTPAVVGWLRPMLLMPASAMTGLSAEQLQAIFAHELAHIRRHDFLVNLIQTVVETLLFYHPAIWWVSTCIRAERENCCDDIAADICGGGVAYARTLLTVEELKHPTPRLAVAAGGGSLIGRIRRLVGNPSDNSARSTRWLAGAVTMLLLVTLTVSTTLFMQACDKPKPQTTGEAAHPTPPESEAVDHAAQNGVSAVETSKLEMLDVTFDPIRQGKNVVHVKVRNVSDSKRTFGIHIYTRSPQYGKSGMGWGTPFFAPLKGDQAKEFRFPFKIHGPITDDTRIELKFYGLESEEAFDTAQHSQQRKYTASSLKRRPAQRVLGPAKKERTEQITAAFGQIQAGIKAKDYQKVWESFSTDYQQVEFTRNGFEKFVKAMNNVGVWGLFAWDREEFLALIPEAVVETDRGIALTARRKDQVWTIDFAREDGLWKIDWIGGYVPGILLVQNWQQRLLPTMEKRSTEHFDIYYSKNSTAESEINQIAQLREQGYQKICKFMGRSIDRRIRLVLFEDKQTKLRQTGYQGMGWAEDSTIIEVYGPEGKLNLYHETVHILVEDIGGPPDLFTEGLAVYVSEQLGSHALEHLGGRDSSLYARVRQLKADGDWIDLDKLITYDVGTQNPPVSYAESGAFAKFLIEQYGMGKFMKAYGQLKNSDSPDIRQENQEILNVLYGESLSQLEQRWIKAFQAAIAAKPEDSTPSTQPVGNGVTIFYIFGDVPVIGEYAIRKATVTRALAAAKYTFDAKGMQAVIFRRNQDGTNTHMVLDIDAIAAGRQKDIDLQPNEMILVKQPDVKTMAALEQSKTQIAKDLWKARERKTDLQGQLDKLEKKFGSQHKRVKSVAGELEATRGMIDFWEKLLAELGKASSTPTRSPAPAATTTLAEKMIVLLKKRVDSQDLPLEWRPLTRNTFEVRMPASQPGTSPATQPDRQPGKPLLAALQSLLVSEVRLTVKRNFLLKKFGAQHRIVRAASEELEKVQAEIAILKNLIAEHIDATPSAATEFYVSGEVPRPGAYSLTGRKVTVKQALAAAGYRFDVKGMQAIIFRRNTDGSETRMVLDVDAIVAGTSKDIYLQPDDTVIVQQSRVAKANAAAEALLQQTLRRALSELQARLAEVQNAKTKLSTERNELTIKFGLEHRAIKVLDKKLQAIEAEIAAIQKQIREITDALSESRELASKVPAAEKRKRILFESRLIGADGEDAKLLSKWLDKRNLLPKLPDGIANGVPARFLTDSEVTEFLAQTQKFDSARTLTAPRMTLFEGQPGSIDVTAPLPILLPLADKPSKKVEVELAYTTSLKMEGSTNKASDAVDTKYTFEQTLARRAGASEEAAGDTNEGQSFYQNTHEFSAAIPNGRTLLILVPRPTGSTLIPCAVEVTDADTDKKIYQPATGPVDFHYEYRSGGSELYLLIKPTILPEPEKKADK